MTQQQVSCPFCGTANPGSARFCMACGNSLEVPCPSCASELPPAARFCFNCGHELEVGATASEPGRAALAVADEINEAVRAASRAVGERRTITMLFCDVMDSSATAELLDPEEWAEIMREVMDCFVTSVERYGGTVARLLGDAVLAYFGAPVAHEDDPQRAVLAALDIVDGFSGLGQRVRADHGTNFDVRVGINTGLVVVGDVGSSEFGEYAALGDAANVAARMEQTAEPGTIRVAEATHRLIAPLFETTPVGTMKVKGRAAPVATHVVVRAKGVPGQVRGIEGLASPLIGRNDEFEQLTAARNGVAAGSGRIVSLVGEAGLGKSRLVHELRTSSPPDLRWLAGTCHSYLASTPYAPFKQLVASALDLDREPGDCVQIIEPVVDLLGSERRDDALHLCALLGLALDDEDAARLAYMEPGTLRARTFEAVASVLESLAKRGPLVVEIEDLHWADTTSVELVEYLLPLVDRISILFLLLYRPDRDQPSWRLHEVAQRRQAHRHSIILLHALPTSDAQDLLQHLLHVEGLSPQLREAILAKAEGNPFHVEEVIRSLLDKGVIKREGDRFVVSGEVGAIEVPETLAAVLNTRLDSLDADARRVLQTAAVLGREFSLELLGMLAPPHLDLESIVAELQRRELLVEARRTPVVTLAFRHALTRDAAYDTLLVSVRRDLHRIVGKLLEELHPDLVFELAHHFSEADEPRSAVPYLVASGEQAFAALARQDAAGYFRRALDQWDEGQDLSYARRSREGLGNALLMVGEAAAAADNFEQMLAFSRAHGDLLGEVSALNKGGLVHLVGLGDVDGAEERMLAAKELAEATDLDAGKAEFYVGYCVLNVTKGRLDKAEEHLGEAAEVCFTLDSWHRNFGLTHYGAALIYQLRFDAARAALSRAREQAQLDDDREHLSQSTADDALIDLYTGHPAVGLDKASSGLAIAEEVSAAHGIIGSAWVAGMCALRLGELDGAKAFFTKVLTVGKSIGDTSLPTAAAVGLGTIAGWVHGTASAEVAEHFGYAKELFDTPLGQAMAGIAFSEMAVDRIVAGDLETAEEVLEIARKTPSAASRLAQPEILNCSAWLALARGDDAAAVELFAQLDAMVETTGMNMYRWQALVGRAITAELSGDVDGAARWLSEAEADTRARSMRLDELAVQRVIVARMGTLAGREDLAAEARARAAETVADIAANMGDHEMRRAFLRTNAT